ncbi:MAG: MFS transporter [Legionella sp.]|nr:MFS transporter [Legionella sp.]
MSNSRKIAWFVWIIASIFYAYQYILRVMPSIMLTDLMHQFKIDTTVFGQFSGIYYIGYSLMHLPIGIMLDRFGPRKVMTSCILLTVIGLLPIVYAHDWVYPIIGRLLIGIGSSAAILGTFKIIRMTFSEHHFTRMLSLSVTIGLLGAIYGGGPVSYMCTLWGYHTVVQIFILIGLLLAFLTYCIVPEMESVHESSIAADMKTVFTNPKVLLLCLFAGMMVGPLEGFADVWGSVFLKQVYGMDASVATYLPSMIFMGMCFGSPVLSFIAEKSGFYLGSIIGAGLVMLTTFILLVSGALAVESITFGFILVGVCCAYQILAIYKASTYVPEHVAGLTTAVANMIIMSFGYVLHSLIGYLVQLYGGPQTANALIHGISVIPFTLLIGVSGFIVIALRERFKLSSKLTNNQNVY